MRLRNTYILLVFSVLLSACGGSNVKLGNPTIPEPLVEQLPLNVAARYPTNFDHFIHEEKVIGKEKWSIDLGGANKLLFDQLFGSMFNSYSVVDQQTNPQDLNIDAFIEPSIDAFEFSVPKQSQSDEFAVWIRYRIKIFDGNGTQVANWPIAAYGKSQKASIGNDEALRRAAVLAMRDAAALIILQMDKSTGISKLTATETTPDVPQDVPQALEASNGQEN